MSADDLGSTVSFTVSHLRVVCLSVSSGPVGRLVKMEHRPLAAVFVLVRAQGRRARELLKADGATCVLRLP